MCCTLSTAGHVPPRRAVLGTLDQVESVIREHDVRAILISTRKLPRAREGRLSAVARLHGVRLYRLDVAIVAVDPEAVAPVSPADEECLEERAAARPGVVPSERRT
jgi:hypothetical protein